MLGKSFTRHPRQLPLPSLEDQIASSELIIMVFAVLCLQLGHANDHSPPSSAKVQRAWTYCSTPHTFSA